jgi:carbamoyl-phosphate synthase large subunit
MGDVVSIIVTGAGAPGIAGTIYSLRNNPDNIEFKIVSTDIIEDPVGKYLSDEFYMVPPPENDTYIDIMKRIIERTNAKVILPQTTREIIVLSRRKEDFKAIGVNIVVSDYENLLTANDKFSLLEKAKEIGIPYPKYYLVTSQNSFMEAVEKLGYPQEKVVVKPRVSNGMRGLRIITPEKWNVKRFLSEKPEGVEIDLNSFIEIFYVNDWPELIVTEYLPGNEYTVDVFKDGTNVIVIPRLRKSIRSGITFEAQVEFREDLINFSKKLSEALDLNYCFGFQFKLSKEGIPKILECNPRVQGSMVVSTFAGFNMIYYAVKKALGFEVDLNNIKLREVQFKRYWGGIAIGDEEFFGRI